MLDSVNLPACRPARKSASEFNADNYAGRMVQASGKYAAAYGEAGAAFAFVALSAACISSLNATPAC